MKYILFDGAGHENLKPLTLTKPVAKLRVGILTIEEKWNHYLQSDCGVRTKDYLTSKYSGVDAPSDFGILAGLLPTQDLVETIQNLKKNQLLMKDGEVLAISPMPGASENMEKILKGSTLLEYDMSVSIVRKPWDIFSLNGQEIASDFEILTKDKESQPLHESNTIIGAQIFVEEGATVLASVLNANEGPIYIGKNATVMEGAMIRGAFALCESATIKMGAKIYGPTTIGPHSKVGGEVGNAVLLGYSNKGHDGYLGNSVIGEWCNLGADTNTSNLKNNYSNVRAWSYLDNEMIETGLQFCGLIMGDHSKCGINTMFNTGTVVGVCANVFDAGFPPKFVPSFSWGGKESVVRFKLDKAFEVAAKVMERRSIELTDDDKEILSHISSNSSVGK